jgi:hypothetical protein
MCHQLLIDLRPMKKVQDETLVKLITMQARTEKQINNIVTRKIDTICTPTDAGSLLAHFDGVAFRA